MATDGLDILTRHRYLRHLTEAEEVSRPEAMAFLDVLSEALANGEPEGEEMRTQIEARISMLKGFSAAVEAAGRTATEAEKAFSAREALERVSSAGDDADPGAVRAYAGHALDALTAKRAG